MRRYVVICSLVLGLAMITSAYAAEKLPEQVCSGIDTYIEKVIAIIETYQTNQKKRKEKIDEARLELQMILNKNKQAMGYNHIKIEKELITIDYILMTLSLQNAMKDYSDLNLYIEELKKRQKKMTVGCQ